MFIFSAILGAAAYLLMRMMRQVQNPITYLLYAQFALLHALIVFHNLVQQSVHMVLFRGDSGCDISGIA